MQNKETEILKAAENMVRSGGYNAFSFREIAKVVGIKSSSVHYHFPTKADLGEAVAKYYTERFLANLGDPADLVADGQNPIAIYVDAFRTALTKDKRMCLCGLLGAEFESLPPGVAKQTRIFFEQNVAWLEKAYALQNDPRPKEKAHQALALLEGAMIMSSALGNLESFEEAAKALL